MTWPLKLKYRNPNRRKLKRPFDPPEGTLVFFGENHTSKQRTNAGKAKSASIRPRMKSYYGSITR